MCVVLKFVARLNKSQLQPLIQKEDGGKQQCSASPCSLTVDHRGWGMELCFESAAPARDACFVESREADAPPPSMSQQELMGSGIVGYLYQFPLGRGERRRPGLFSKLAFHRLAGPLALTYTYMIMKCHIFHSSWARRFKGQEQSVVCHLMQREEEESSDWALGGNKAPTAATINFTHWTHTPT